jgi:hypothetical protein
MELLDLALVGDDDLGAVHLIGLDLEGPLLHVFLQDGIGKRLANHPFEVIDRVGGVAGSQGFGFGSDFPLGFGERDEAWESFIAVFVGEDEGFAVIGHCDVGVAGSEVNSNAGALIRNLLNEFVPKFNVTLHL